MVKPHSSISLKITVLVLCGTSIVFALALAYSYSYSRRIILEEAESSARNLALSVARRIEQEFRAAAKVPKGLTAVLEASNTDKETLLGIIRRMVEESREVYGSAVAFEPHTFEKDLRWFAPYLLQEQSRDHIRTAWIRCLRLFHERLVPRSKSPHGPGLDRSVFR